MGTKIKGVTKRKYQNWRNHMKSSSLTEYLGITVMLVIVTVHLALAWRMQYGVEIGGDGIFSYTLANNPYSFEFIDSAYKKLPQNNGWVNAHILKENYVAEDYNCFNYPSVYFHQRLDVHPLLYYSLVHTICSVFKGTYSSFYTTVINWFFLLAADILILHFFRKIYGKVYYAAVPFAFLFLMTVMQRLYLLPRMYMMLAFFCFWYLFIHWDLIIGGNWKKSSLVKMFFCIFLGTQTHYYFYVYACILTLFTVTYLIYKRKRYELCNYLYSGIIGIAASWILFPWVIWHIFFNQQQKHTDIVPWSAEKLKEYVSFLNIQLFHGRGLEAFLIIAVIGIFGIFFRKKILTEIPERVLFRRIVFGSGIIYSVIIFTLDGANWYYMTPLYLPFILWSSMILIRLMEKIVTSRKIGGGYFNRAICYMRSRNSFCVGCGGIL